MFGSLLNKVEREYNMKAKTFSTLRSLSQMTTPYSLATLDIDGRVCCTLDEGDYKDLASAKRWAQIHSDRAYACVHNGRISDGIAVIDFDHNIVWRD